MDTSWIGMVPIIGGILLVFLILASKGKSRELGDIKCKRCHHLALAKTSVSLLRGVRFVCANCGSEDWEKVGLASSKGITGNSPQSTLIISEASGTAGDPVASGPLAGRDVAGDIMAWWRCEHCKKLITSESRLVGKSIKCPGCDGQTKISNGIQPPIFSNQFIAYNITVSLVFAGGMIYQAGKSPHLFGLHYSIIIAAFTWIVAIGLSALTGIIINRLYRDRGAAKMASTIIFTFIVLLILY